MQTPREAARERQLFEAFVAGDDAAFAALFRRYHDRLVRDARRYVPEDIAEDLVQDVFGWLWTHRARWQIRTTVRNYLHGAVRNRARDLIARAKTEHRATDAYQRTMDERHEVGPDELLLAQELERAIEDGLATCPARCRAALLLLQDRPCYADIARQLGVKSGTVQALVKRGRHRLRAYLRQQGWEEILGGLPALSVLGEPSMPPSRRAADHVGRSHVRRDIERSDADRLLDTDFDLAG